MADEHELDRLLRDEMHRMELRRAELYRSARWHLTGIAILTIIAIALQFVIPGGMLR